MIQFNQQSIKEIETKNRVIKCFQLGDSNDTNIDLSVVESFGEEWLKFHGFDDNDITKLSETYFDIVDEKMINKTTTVLDAGCGSGRFSNYLADKVAFVEAIDPSNAVFAADKVLESKKNIRISKASIGNMPFGDESFDFVMSIGVLHHIPNTQQAMQDCVKKVKKGGYFFTYLYYNLENKGFVFRSIYHLVSLIRKMVSALPQKIKKIVCDIIAILVYMPVIAIGRIVRNVGFEKIALGMPLSYYQNQSFLVIRNDALDRFGTTLEQRFSKQEVIEMMSNCGLSEIIVSDKLPMWHAVGRKN